MSFNESLRGAYEGARVSCIGPQNTRFARLTTSHNIIQGGVTAYPMKWSRCAYLFVASKLIRGSRSVISSYLANREIAPYSRTFTMPWVAPLVPCTSGTYKIWGPILHIFRPLILESTCSTDLHGFMK